jgi:integrase
MALTATRIKNAGTGRHGDGRGLYLQVTKTGGRSWILRLQLHKRKRWIGLGSLDVCSLEQARDLAHQQRRMAKLDGVDPLAARRLERAKQATKVPTFEEAAQEYFNLHESKWTNANSRDQFLSSLRIYAYPFIGSLMVSEIDTKLVLAVIKPIWSTKTPTADRVRRRIEAVLGWATVAGHREGANPARWQKYLSEVLPKPSSITEVVHHPALPHADIPAFMAELRMRKGVEARALEFLILCASRTNEVVGARWSEFDLDAGVWTVPARRMKGRVVHRVPLTDRALKILQDLPTEGDFVFIGPRGAKLSKMLMPKLLGAIRPDVTIHGFRASFSSWAAVSTNYAPEVREASLAHVIGAVEAAYQREDLLNKRRMLMRDWAAYTQKPVRADNVRQIRRTHKIA